MINYNIAKKQLESGIVSDCKEFFKENNFILEYGYCLMLEGKLKEADRVFRTIDSLRANWAIRLIPFMEGYVEIYPTYFQIRNFLEIDLNLLLLAKQLDSIAYILGGADLLYSVNIETYKYIARVLMNNGFYQQAKEYLNKASCATQGDPELYFMICNYCLHEKDYQNALKAVNECLNILPEYYPALKVKEALIQK